MTTTHLTDSAQALDKQITGSVLTPGDAGYDETRRGFNRAIDQHPAMILIAENVQDVVAGVLFARENGLGV